MPPQQRNHRLTNENDSDEDSVERHHHGGMRRVVSNAEISVAAPNEHADSGRDYKVRKSSLIG